MRRFDRAGLSGLAEGHPSGRPARRSAEQREEGRAWVRPPAAAAVAAQLWDGKRRSACRPQRCGVALSVRPCQRRFRLVETRCRLRRPLVAQADPQPQAEHKKNSRAWRTIRRSLSGPWPKSLFVNRARAGAWGCRGKRRLQCGGRIRAERAWATMGPFACALATAGAGRRRRGSTGRRFGAFCDRWRAPVRRRGGGGGGLSATPKTLRPSSRPAGGRKCRNAAPWISCPRNSPELNPLERGGKRTRRNGLHNGDFPKRTLVAEAVAVPFAQGSAPQAERAGRSRR